MPIKIICKECNKKKKHKARRYCASCYEKLFKKEKTVKCINCGEIKKHRSIGLCSSCYNKQRKGKGKKIICLDCNKEKIHEAKGLCSACWGRNKRRTLDGLISKMYSSILARTRLKSYPAVIQRGTFLKIAKKNKYLKIIFDAWVESNYQSKLTPTVDRINNSLGYLKGNIQFLTLSDNDLKKFNDASDSGHRIRVVFENKELLYFNSMANASKYMGKSHCYMREVFNGRIPAKGFIAKKVTNEEYMLNRSLDPYFPYWEPSKNIYP